MADAEHVHLVPLIEAALAIMRLSCEKVVASRGLSMLQHCGKVFEPAVTFWAVKRMSDGLTWCLAVLRAGLGVCGVPAVPGAAAHGAPRHPAERAPVGHVPEGGVMQPKDPSLCLHAGGTHSHAQIVLYEHQELSPALTLLRRSSCTPSQPSAGRTAPALFSAPLCRWSFGVARRCGCWSLCACTPPLCGHQCSRLPPR